MRPRHLPAEHPSRPSSESTRREPRTPTTPADLGVFGISVAADLVGMGTQTLRLYETRGLLEPDRTAGGTRRYSRDDLDRLRHIGELLAAGLNLAGIAMVLDLEEQNTQLRATSQERP